MQTNVQTDPYFVTFTELKWGFRAAWKLMASYYAKFNDQHKVFNILNIICRWAPPSENNTLAYINTVVKLSGIGDLHSLPNPEVNGEEVARVIAAMVCVENGIKMEQVPMDDLWAGYQEAWPHPNHLLKERE